jgi:hypothetical protein
VPEIGQTTLSPVCLPYSPEWVPRKPGQGAAALDRLAKATGGSQRLDLSDIWRELPRKLRYVPMAPTLLLISIALLLLEVFERRTGLLQIVGKSFARRLLARSPRGIETRSAVPDRRAQPARSVPASAPPASERPRPDKPTVAKKVANEDMDDALGQARQRARRRTERS